jgi:hypothetical protein
MREVVVAGLLECGVFNQKARPISYSYVEAFSNTSLLHDGLLRRMVLGLAKPAKPVKTMPYVTDLCLLEILDSPACNLCLWSILRLAAIAPTTFSLFPLCVGYCLLLGSRRVPPQ